MKRNNLILMLPAFNEEEALTENLRNLKSYLEIDDFPWMDEIHIIPLIIDDGSEDNTFESAVREVKPNLRDGTIKDAIVLKSKVNRGLTNTLRKGYQVAVDYGMYHILRTDVDSDFSLKEVLRTFVPLVFRDPQFICGRREKSFDLEHPNYGLEQRYECKRRQDILRIMNEEYGSYPVDPATCGTQLWRYDLVEKLLKNDHFQRHDKPWGLDFLAALLFPQLVTDEVRFEGAPIAYLSELKKGEFDLSRRPIQKIKTQYDIYVETVAILKEKNPRELSELYGK